MPILHNNFFTNTKSAYPAHRFRNNSRRRTTRDPRPYRQRQKRKKQNAQPQKRTKNKEDDPNFESDAFSFGCLFYHSPQYKGCLDSPLLANRPHLYFSRPFVARKNNPI